MSVAEKHKNKLNDQIAKSRQIKPHKNAAPFCLEDKMRMALDVLMRKQIKLRKAKSFHINIDSIPGDRLHNDIPFS